MTRISYNFLYFLFLLLLLLSISACQKSEKLGLGNAGLIMVGSHAKIELIDLQPTGDGGYLLTAHTRQNQNQDIALFKYNAKLVLEWQRVIGGEFDDIGQKVFIDKDENILTTGFSYGYGLDSIRPRITNHWMPYVHLMNSNGVTIWEELAFFWNYNLPYQQINDVVQDVDDNYLISGRYYGILQDSNANIIGPYLLPSIIKMERNGTYSNRFGRSRSSELASIESVFQFESRIYAFGQGMESTNQAECFSINPNDMQGFNRCELIDTIDWQSSAQTSDPILATLKVQQGEVLQTFIVNRNSVYRYELNISQSKLTSKFLPIQFKDIIWAGQSATAFFFITKDGWVYETDFDLNITNSFLPSYRIQQVYNHPDNGYVAVTKANDAIQVLHLNTTGQVIDNE